MTAFKSSRTSERPTLPPLHSLNLPFLNRESHAYDSSCDTYEHQPYSPLHAHTRSHHHGLRKASTSSSNTTASRSPSPSLSPSSLICETHLNNDSGRKVRLVPCSLEDADAVILVPPPSAPYISVSPTTPVKDGEQGRPLLLVGSAMQHLRHPQRQIAKGARVHPYRIMPSTGSRRSSVASTTSQSAV